eukprot:1144205-Pelagomonas_calceolata.AAC.1
MQGWSWEHAALMVQQHGMCCQGRWSSAAAATAGMRGTEAWMPGDGAGARAAVAAAAAAACARDSAGRHALALHAAAVQSGAQIGRSRRRRRARRPSGNAGNHRPALQK